MFNPKNVGICAFIGFALSFVIGLISSNSIGRCFFNALIYAVVFGALCVGITFIYQKFLSIDKTDSDSSSEDGHFQPAQGSNVDITIDDDSLPDDENGPKFVVSRTESVPPEMRAETQVSESADNGMETASSGITPMSDDKADTEHELDVLPDDSTGLEPPDSLPDEEVRKEEPPAAPVQENAGEQPASQAFVPVNLADNAAPVQKTEKPSGSGGVLDELGELPDIGELSPDSKNESSGDVINDSEFASAGSPSVSASAPTFSDGKPAAEQNAAVMAEAIRTVLAKE